MDPEIQKQWDKEDGKVLWKARRNLKRGALIAAGAVAAIPLTMYVSQFFAFVVVVGGCFALHYAGKGYGGYYMMPKYRIERDRELRRAKRLKNKRR